MVVTQPFLLPSKPVPIGLVQGTLTSVLVREKAKQEEYRVTNKNPEMSSQVLVCRSLCKAIEKPAGRVGREWCLHTALAWKGEGVGDCFARCVYCLS